MDTRPAKTSSVTGNPCVDDLALALLAFLGDHRLRPGGLRPFFKETDTEFLVLTRGETPRVLAQVSIVRTHGREQKTVLSDLVMSMASLPNAPIHDLVLVEWVWQQTIRLTLLSTDPERAAPEAGFRWILENGQMLPCSFQDERGRVFLRFLGLEDWLPAMRIGNEAA